MASDNGHRRPPRIVILGAGFAGAYCAQALKSVVRRFNADVLVIDRHNYFVFTPLLVEAGTGSLEPRHAIVPIRHFLDRAMRFRMAEVLGIDPERKVVRYRMIGSRHEKETPYDHLVISLGSTTMLPPVPGLKEHGWEMKCLNDSVALRDRMIALLELANSINDAKKRARLLHLVVVGASYTGVEVAGEFNEFLRKATRHYRNLTERDIRVTLVEKADRILPMLDNELAVYAHRQMSRRGIRIITGKSLKEIGRDKSVLENDEVLDSRTVVWCAGIRQNPVAEGFPLPKDERNYILCDRDLRVQGHDSIWAIGDGAVNLDRKGRAYPATAQHAVRMGTHVARNIERLLLGDKPKPFNFRMLGTLAALGYHAAIAKVLGVRVSGFPAWWLWRTVYLMKTPLFSRKVRVAVDWTIDLLFPHDIVQIGIHGRRIDDAEDESDV